MWGRLYRKSLSQAVAFIWFRWIAVWLLVVSLAGMPNGTALSLIVIVLDLGIRAVGVSTFHQNQETRRQDWHDRLTNRLFYRLFYESVRDGRLIDVDVLFEEATRMARKDIEKAQDDEMAFSPKYLDKTWWHWIGGVISFVWLGISMTLYYGSAIALGGNTHNSLY